MIKYLLLFLPVAFSILLYSCGDQSTKVEPTEISGKIVSESNGYPLGNAFIKTEPPSSSVISDMGGLYLIQNLTPGPYTVIVEKSGYYTNRITVNVVEGKTTIANIPLRNIKENNKAPEVPILSFPTEGSDVNPKDLTVSWSCSDPDGDNLTYDIYLGKSKTALLMIDNNINENSYKILEIDDSSTYFIRIIAKDIWGASTESKVISFTTISSNAANVSHDSLIAYYALDGNALDHSSNKLNGNVINAQPAPDRNGNMNSAYYFNGKNSYIEIPNSNKFNFRGDYTISAWIKPDANPGKDYQGHIDIISRCAVPWGGYYLGISTSLYMEYWTTFSNQGLNSIFSSSPISSNKWYHVSIRFIKNNSGESGTIDLLINGVVINTSDFHLPDIVNTSLMIGARNNFQNYYAGYVDEVLMFNRALSNQEIMKLADK